MTVLTATGLTGIPGIATSLAGLATVILWVRVPLVALAAVPCIALAVLTCVLATRLASALTSGLDGNRRGRELVGTLVLILIVLAGPILMGALRVLSPRRTAWGRSSRAGAVLGWTPFGAAWAVPGDLATGAPVTAALRAVIAVATPVALWFDGAARSSGPPSRRRAAPHARRERARWGCSGSCPPAERGRRGRGPHGMAPRSALPAPAHHGAAVPGALRRHREPTGRCS